MTSFVKLNVLVFASIIGLATLSLPSFAKEKNGVSMEDTLDVGGKKLVLNGLGVRRAFGVVKVYVGGLYLEKPSKNNTEIIESTGIKQIRLKFLMDVDREKLNDAWVEGFKKNCTEKCEENKAPLDVLVAQMESMKNKDVLSFTIYPDKVEVSVRGVTKPAITGATFAKTMLSVFIGANPPNAALKEGMLGED